MTTPRLLVAAGLAASLCAPVGARQPPWTPPTRSHHPDIPYQSVTTLGAASYAKIVCSGVFVSGRDVEEVRKNSADFLMTEPVRQKPLTVDVDRAQKCVRVTVEGTRLAQIHTEAKGGGLEVPDNQQVGLIADPTTPPVGPSGGGGLYSTAEDYLWFCQMLLDGGVFGGQRLLAPRSVEMMRTNHLSAEALETYRPGQGFNRSGRYLRASASMAGQLTSSVSSKVCVGEAGTLMRKRPSGATS